MEDNKMKVCRLTEWGWLHERYAELWAEMEEMNLTFTLIQGVSFDRIPMLPKGNNRILEHLFAEEEKMSEAKRISSRIADIERELGFSRLSEEEIGILKDRFVYEKTYERIGMEHDYSINGIYKKTRSILDKLNWVNFP